jgi:succinate dehydrogenase/fumarate reductase iron-sulfur protein
MSPGTIAVRIARTDPDARSEFVVDRYPAMTVLDTLLAVQREHDPTIAFRYSCRVAMCGTCTLRVNGKSTLACQALVGDEETELTIDPVAGLPVIRDLLVDMQPFWDRWAQVKPYLVPKPGATEPARLRPDSPERQMISAALDCIGCGACYSSCGIAAGGRDFLGPAALNRAMVLIADSRDDAGAERLKIIEDEGGVNRCHYIYGCSADCPKGLDPAASIRTLRRWMLDGDG